MQTLCKYLIYYDVYLNFCSCIIVPWVLLCCWLALWMRLTDRRLSLSFCMKLNSCSRTVRWNHSLKKQGSGWEINLVLAPNSLVFVLSAFLLSFTSGKRVFFIFKESPFFFFCSKLEFSFSPRIQTCHSTVRQSSAWGWHQRTVFKWIRTNHHHLVYGGLILHVLRAKMLPTN